MADDAAVLLGGARQEARHVDKGHERDVEGVAEAHEARALVGSVDVQSAGHHLRLVGDHAHWLAVEMGESDHDVHRVEGLRLQELAAVDDHRDDVLDVVWLLGVVGDDRRQPRRLAVRVVRRLDAWRLVVAALRDVSEELANLGEALFFALRQEVSDAGFGVVDLRASKRVEGHVLARRHPDDLGARDEHVAHPVDHESEVGDRRRVHGAPRARAEDQAQLGDDAARLDVAPEDLGVTGERDDAFLDPGAAGVVDPDHRTAVLHGHVHELADLLGEHLAQRTPEDGEVLREEEDLPAEDRAVARDDRVAVRAAVHHPEVRFAVAHVAVELDERARVAELLRSLASEQPPFLAPPLHRLLAARVQRLVAQLAQPLQLRLRRVVRLRHRRGA